MGYKSRLLVSAGIPDESGTSKRVVVLRASLIFLCASLLVSPVAAQSQSLADLEIKIVNVSISLAFIRRVSRSQESAL